MWADVTSAVGGVRYLNQVRALIHEAHVFTAPVLPPNMDKSGSEDAAVYVSI